ncbi:TPA: hypothetical protein QIF01_004873 [Serratia marcescens]|nr:hypothetical protein [Serratia marcescens]HEP0989099.1 hypothetical protein [Serratia marcescens]
MKIKAIRMFSHYTLGNFSQGDVRIVEDEVGKALIAMHLATEVKEEEQNSKREENNKGQPDKPKTGGKSGNKRRTAGAD